MAKLIYTMMMTLDGYISRPDGALDWVLIDDELHDFVNAQQDDIATYLLGRKTFDMMESYWPTADEDPDAPGYVADYARIWREMPKVVFSSSQSPVAGKARLASGDARSEIARLKAESDMDLSVGGPTLAASIVDLIDEFHIFLNPVLIGQGAPLLPGFQGTTTMQLGESHTFINGVMFLRYTRSDRT